MARATITGVADTAMGELTGSTALGLHAQAANDALADAGLTSSDIDGVLCAYSLTVPQAASDATTTMRLLALVPMLMSMKPSKVAVYVDPVGATSRSRTETLACGEMP